MAGPTKQLAASLVASLNAEQAEQVLARLTPEQKLEFADLLSALARDRAASAQTITAEALREGAISSENNLTNPADLPSLGPVIGADEIAWFSVGLRWKSETDRMHQFVVTCNHCGIDASFDVSGRNIHPHNVDSSRIGYWMINHRRQHR